jgi:hypothetical protein
MPYIIEGCPQVGKTYFLKSYLSAKYYIKESDLSRDKIVQEDVQKMQLALFKAIPILNSDDVIFDRFYPSEIVFGSDRYTIDLDFYKKLDFEWALLDFKVILINIPHDLILHPRYTLEEHNKWYQRYLEFLSWTKLPYFIFNANYETNTRNLRTFFKV